MYRYLALLGVLLVAACGNNPTDRALTGGAIGAASGAVVGSTMGNPLAGAAIGGLGGAAIGAATSPQPVYVQSRVERNRYYGRNEQYCTRRSNNTYYCR